MIRGVPVALAVVLLASACGGGGTRTVTVEHTVTRVRTVAPPPPATTAATAATAPCGAHDVQATFALVPGSPAAGTVVYRLTLTSTTNTACTVSGLPVAELLDAQGSPLPTHVSAAQPGAVTQVTLGRGDSATADARFSPDVPGVGEGNAGGRCEPEATTLRVVLAGGTVDAPITPATSVCEHGALGFSAYAPAS